MVLVFIVFAVRVCASAQTGRNVVPKDYKLPRGCAFMLHMIIRAPKEFDRGLADAAVVRVSEDSAASSLRQWSAESSPEVLLKDSHAADYFVVASHGVRTQNFTLPVPLPSYELHGYELICGLHGFDGSE
jgi:hypothetical protein